MSYSSGNNSKASDGLKIVSHDEFHYLLGPGGRYTAVTSAQDTIARYEDYASRNPVETAHDNIQLRSNVSAERTSTTKSSQEMHHVRKIGRLMKRVEVLEAENRALKKKNGELEDMQAKKEQQPADK
ncbi:hypothetical protein FMEXI_389 [Fusarium mexicanum]|uniref:Uncharacterized protein n=1 Tax=Fusarium mexicanum TaxID=751941 RepID=A0A8H5NB68_9HYPO|nr:hypothetical protein FMEXI_389 [Fusarium mexicanum]